MTPKREHMRKQETVIMLRELKLNFTYYLFKYEAGSEHQKHRDFTILGLANENKSEPNAEP